MSIAIQPVTFTPDVSVAGNGTVTGTGIDCGVDCTEDYINGTDVELTGTPDAGWVLLEWLGAGAGSAPGTRSVTMDQDQALTARLLGIADDHGGQVGQPDHSARAG